MFRRFILLAALVSLLVSGATQAQDSYIIVHALNPEGIEINSIAGIMNRVEIWDGDDWFIDYAPYDDLTHNMPILIEPGTNTIKAKFNGMELSQNINLQEGETKVLIFTFPRIDFDISSYIDALDFNRKLEINREFNLYYPGLDYYDFSHTYVEDYISLADLPNDPYRSWILSVGGGAKLNWFGEASATGMYKAIAQVQLSSTGYYEYWFAQSQIWDSQGYCRPEVYSGAGVGSSHFYRYASELPINIPVYTSFYQWFIQFIGSGKFPEMYGTFNDGSFLLCGWAGSLNESSYRIYNLLGAQPLQYVKFNPYHWDDEPLGINGTYEGTSHIISGTLSNLKMSSVPYDLLGTGIPCGGGGPPPPPENKPPVASFKSLNVTNLGHPEYETTNEGYHMVGGAIRFDASESYDPDPGGTIQSYQWNFDGGERRPSSPDQKPDVVFKEEKVYTITLVIIDNMGMPSEQFTETLDLRLQKGDLIFLRSGFPYAQAFDLIGNFYTHVGMYIGDQQMIESIKYRSPRSNKKGVVITPLSGWSYPSETYAVLMRVRTADVKIIQGAIEDFAMGKVGQQYDTRLWQKSLDQRNYYCSELIWAAYYKASQGSINLGLKQTGGLWDWFTPVSPDDMIIHDNVNFGELIGFHQEFCP